MTCKGIFSISDNLERNVIRAPLFVRKDFDLARQADIGVVGRIDPRTLGEGIKTEQLVRPRRPLSPWPDGTPRRLPRHYPALMHALNLIAAENMRERGLNPNKFFVYLLYHTAIVPPGEALREPQWHFDLLRMMRGAHENYIPLAYEYSVSSILPTQFITKIFNMAGKALRAYETINDPACHQQLGNDSHSCGYYFEPRPGEVVRYTNLVMHRGQINHTRHEMMRSFAHIAFSPFDPDRPADRVLLRNWLPSP